VFNAMRATLFFRLDGPGHAFAENMQLPVVAWIIAAFSRVNRTATWLLAPE
jgi:tryptophan-rich sensory protein